MNAGSTAFRRGAAAKAAMLGLALIGATIFQVPVAAASEPTPAQVPSLIAFEMRSWGRLLSSWIIGPDGGGNWREAKPNTSKMIAHDLSADSESYGQLLRALRQLPYPAPDFEDCRNFMTDQPYGKLRITRGATTTEYAWNAGCMDEPYARFLSTLRAANELVTARGRKGKILREEEANE